MSEASENRQKYGWPLARRTEEFRRASAETGLPTFPIVFKGKKRDFPVITIPIGLPKYRMANGRTASSQKEYIARNDVSADFFDRDPELEQAQVVQHGLLQSLVKKAGLLDHFKDASKTQVDPILLDEFGFVVNGNRRLCTWRDLYNEEKKDYGHFSHIEVVVLPHCDEREIDRLEAALQIQKDIRADYTWHTEANMMKQKMDAHGFSTKELAELYGKKESEIKELLLMRKDAEDYLISRGKKDLWSEIGDGDEYAFRELVKARSKVTSAGEQELFREAAFVLIEKPNAAGKRLYEAIPEIQEYLQPIKQKLQEHFDVRPPELTKGNDPKVSLEQIFGGGLASKPSIDIPLAREIAKDENKEEARKIILEVVRTQSELKREEKNASFLLNSAAKANSLLTAAATQGLRPGTNKKGVEAQLKSIESTIAMIRKWLEGNA